MGKNEGYKLGLDLRKRYDGFLSENYDESEVYFISSDVERAIKTGSTLAYGLYKTYNLGAQWSGNEGIPYEPIPIHTFPAEYDKVKSLQYRVN